MSEMIVYDNHLSNILSGWLGIGVMFIILSLLMLLNYMLKFYNMKKGAYILFSLVIIFAFITVFNYSTIEYTYDYLTESIETKEINFEELILHNRKLCHEEDDTLYYFLVYGTEKEDIINENFGGEKCLIEYYKTSKIVISIRVID